MYAQGLMKLTTISSQRSILATSPFTSVKQVESVENRLQPGGQRRNGQDQCM